MSDNDRTAALDWAVIEGTLAGYYARRNPDSAAARMIARRFAADCASMLDHNRALARECAAAFERAYAYEVEGE